MDKHNLFHTPVTYSLVRLDWFVVGLVPLILVIVNYKEVNWGAFAWAFAAPDLIGTFPGLYYYYGRRSGARRSIPPIIHKLYNFGHSFATTGIVCLIWYFIVGQWEWAMLAFPIHLAGDRSIFGNIYKPLGTAFEPVKHDAFRRFEQEYESAGVW